MHPDAALSSCSSCACTAIRPVPDAYGLGGRAEHGLCRTPQRYRELTVLLPGRRCCWDTQGSWCGTRLASRRSCCHAAPAARRAPGHCGSWQPSSWALPFRSLPCFPSPVEASTPVCTSAASAPKRSSGLFLPQPCRQAGIFWRSRSNQVLTPMPAAILCSA